MQITNCCQLSSFVFIINIIIGIYYKYYLYSLLFIILLITSLIHHSNYTDFTYVLDKTLCLYIVLYGTLLFYQKSKEHFTFINYNYNNSSNSNSNKSLFYFKSILFICIVVSFLIVLYLYYYGYYYKKYVFDTDIVNSFRCHSFIHYLSCFAHSIIMIL